MLTTILEDLASAAQFPLERATIKRAVLQTEAELPGSWDETWQARLLRAGQLIGLSIASVRLPVRDLVSRIRSGAPALLRVQGEEPYEWLILLDAQGKSVRISSAHSSPGEWLSISALARRLGVEVDQPVEVFLASAGLACGPPYYELTATRRLPKDAAHGDSEHGQANRHGHGPGHSHIPPWRRLVRLLQPERKDIISVFWYGVGISVLMLATPIGVEALVNTVAFGSLLQPVVVLALVLFTCLSLAGVMRALQTYVVEVLQRRIFVRVLADLAHRLPRVSVSSFDREHGPELVNRFFDVLTVQKVSATLLMDGLTNILQVLLGMLVVAFYHPVLLAFDLVLFAAIAFIVFVVGRGATATAIQESRAKYSVAEWLEELARHPIAFKTSGGPAFAVDRADFLAKCYLRAREAHFRIVFRQIAGSFVIQAIASTALLGLGGWLVISKSLTLGQLVASELILTVVVSAFVKLGKHMESFYDLMAATEKLGHLTDLELERPEGDAPVRKPEPAQLRITGLTFGYERDRPLLRDFHLDLAPRERVALVGESGCGKSTLVDLLFGLRRPQRGKIELDGVEYRELRLADLREHVATVKRIEIFDGTIEDNIRMGREGILASDLRSTLADVGLLDEVNSYPGGLQTPILTGGSPLSYGQSLRLVLARAIVARPRLLVLDETMDALDPITISRVSEVIFDRSAPWTLLLITNRPDLAALCDRIVEVRPRGDVNGHLLSDQRTNLPKLLSGPKSAE